MSRSTRRSFRRASKRIARLRKTIEKPAGEANRQIADEILTDVVASAPGHGVPRDLGTLAGTGQVEGPNRHGEVTISFGGPAAPYALEQHERLDFAHDKGEARYLVRGLERWEPGGSAAMKALKVNAEFAARVASKS